MKVGSRGESNPVIFKYSKKIASELLLLPAGCEAYRLQACMHVSTSVIITLS